MGQKINPIGLRLGINRGWDSTWFAKKKDFGRYLIEDFKIRKYIKKNITNSGVSEIIIERSSKKCTVSIHTSRPGFVIGKNNLYLTTSHGRLLVVDLKKGKTKSIKKLDNKMISRPFIFNNQIFLATDNSIIKLD